MITNLEQQASVNMIRALIGEKAGYRERSIMDAANATAYKPRHLPNCIGVRSMNPDGSARFFVVRLSDGEIIN